MTQTNPRPRTNTQARTAAPANDNPQGISDAIEKAINECGIRNIAKLPAVMKAIRLAQGMKAIRQALSDDFVLANFMPLQGTTLGFLTDLDRKGGYPLAVVRDCIVEAMMRGFNPVGNEFNIIASRFYGTKAGFERQVSEFPGLTDLNLQPGVPQNFAGGALVPYLASWILDGQRMNLDCQLREGIDTRIPVKVNDGMGADAIIGKATRKMLFRIFQRLNGSAFGVVDGEIGDGDAILTTGVPAPVTVVHPKGALDTIVNAAKAQKARQSERPPAPPLAQLRAIDVHTVLIEADKEWEGEDRLPIVAAWTQDQMRDAVAWAAAFINVDHVDDADLPPRPDFTVLGRIVGEEG
jgi:hypothetical protein